MQDVIGCRKDLHGREIVQIGLQGADLRPMPLDKAQDRVPLLISREQEDLVMQHLGYKVEFASGTDRSAQCLAHVQGDDLVSITVHDQHGHIRR